MATWTISPLWIGNADLEAYGGHLNKRDYLGIGVINPETDIGAETVNATSDHLWAAGNVAPFAVVTIQMGDGYLVSACRTQAGNGPDFYPTKTDVSTGIADVVFETSYDSSLGVSGAISLKQATAQLHGATPGYLTVEITDATTVRVYCFDLDGAPMGDMQITLSVWC